MHGTQEFAATVATSFLHLTLVPIIDLDVIQFAAETVTAATSAPAPDPCRSLTPTRRRKTSAPHPSAGGHLRELTICAGTSTWTPVGIVSNRFCAAANAAVDFRVAAESGLMRFSVARSRCRFSLFSARSEPGGLCLLLAAAAPAAPVEEPVEGVFCRALRVNMADRVCCCGVRRESAISKAAVAQRPLRMSMQVNQSERSTGLACPKLKRVACAQLDRNGEVENRAGLCWPAATGPVRALRNSSIGARALLARSSRASRVQTRQERAA